MSDQIVIILFGEAVIVLLVGIAADDLIMDGTIPPEMDQVFIEKLRPIIRMEIQHRKWSIRQHEHLWCFNKQDT